MRETTVSHISKAEMDYYKEDEKFIEFIKNELTRSLSERVMQVLEAEDDIILKKPILKVSDFPPTHSVEYRKTLDWEPLVRCKDCVYNEGSDNEPWCCFYESGKDQDGFCDKGEKKEDEEDQCRQNPRNDR